MFLALKKKNDLPQAVNDNMAVKPKEDFFGFLKSFLLALLLAITFRTFAYEPFHIPSGSMKPTLLVGDYIFVSKYAYGYSRYSFPFGMKLFEGRILGQAPKRGDVIVFRLPSNPTIHYIKRLIGFPGDRIQVKHGILYINDKAVPREEMGFFSDTDNVEIPMFKETLPGEVDIRVLDQVPYGALDDTDVYTVPEKHYFFMGDNRDNSQDSRVLSLVGFVPEENIVGRAELIFFSSTAEWWQPWTWATSMQLGRFFAPVQSIH